MDEDDPADPYTDAGMRSERVVDALPQIHALALIGYSDQEIAAELRLDVLYVARSRAVLIEATQEQDLRMQRSLYLAGLAGDSKAAATWLKARRPEAWGEHRKITHEVIVNRLGHKARRGLTLVHTADSQARIEQQVQAEGQAGDTVQTDSIENQ